MASTRSTPNPSPTWFIGDVHGCLASLVALEREVGRRCREWGEGPPAFVLLGDLIDRGPDSAGVVAHVRAGVAAGTHRCIMGNHEAILLMVLDQVAPQGLRDAGLTLPLAALSYGGMYGQRLAPAWLWQLGGAETLSSYGVEPRWEARADWRLPDADLRFLAGLPLVHVGATVVATHALVRSPLAFDIAVALQRGDPVASELPAAVWPLFLQELLEGRTPPDVSPVGGRWHVSGHTPLGQLTRHKGARLVRVDTGAVFGGRLTAWCSDLDRFLSVPGLTDPWQPSEGVATKVRATVSPGALYTDDWLLSRSPPRE